MIAQVEKLPQDDDDDSREFELIKGRPEIHADAQEEVPLTSSIGPTWPPRPTSQERIKGFEVRHLVRNPGQIEEYRTLVRRARAGTLDQYLRGRFPAELGNVELSHTRFSFRFIVESELLPVVYEALDSSVEVVIPLAGSEDFEGYSMVYIGVNHDSRQPDPEDLATSIQYVRNAIDRKPKTYAEIVQRVQNEGYELMTPSMDERRGDQALREQVAQLYTRFGWEPESVYGMLEDENNILGIARHGDQIVSAGIAEIAVIPIMTPDGKKEFRIVELTEAATLDGHQNKGLYTGVAAQELRALSLMPVEQQPHLVLGECNGLAAGVLKAARDLNRTFAFEYTDILGDKIKGYLPQHVPIETKGRRTPMNDLFPAYISRVNMRRFAGVE